MSVEEPEFTPAVELPVAEAMHLLRCGDLSLDPASREVRRGAVAVSLTAREFALLEFLMRHPGEALPRATIVEHVWDPLAVGDWNVLEVYVRYLRQKVDRPFGRSSIETVRGVGYRLRDDAGAPR